MKGLFINNKKAKDSIFESGYMVFQCLRASKKFDLDYCEIGINDRSIKTGYDFFFFNYHPVTMGWLETRNLKKQLECVITMILEVAPGDPFVMCPENDFNIYCALDPTIISTKRNLYPLSRPLEMLNVDLPVINTPVPVIGSFGFATKGKGFQHVVDAVNKEFDEAIVRINIPYGDFVPDSKEYALFLAEVCQRRAKPGIEVQITHDFMSKPELIKWCAANTLNCFLYDRNMPGLAATTDQAIVSERPLSISNNDTFRHITSYIKPYPLLSLKESIEHSIPLVKKMKRDWTPEKFTQKFEEVLSGNVILFQENKNKDKNCDNLILGLKQERFADKFERKMKKYKRKLKTFSLKKSITSKNRDELI